MEHKHIVYTDPRTGVMGLYGTLRHVNEEYVNEQLSKAREYLTRCYETEAEIHDVITSVRISKPPKQYHVSIRAFNRHIETKVLAYSARDARKKAEHEIIGLKVEVS